MTVSEVAQVRSEQSRTKSEQGKNSTSADKAFRDASLNTCWCLMIPHAFILTFTFIRSHEETPAHFIFIHVLLHSLFFMLPFCHTVKWIEPYSFFLCCCLWSTDYFHSGGYSKWTLLGDFTEWLLMLIVVCHLHITQVGFLHWRMAE